METVVTLAPIFGLALAVTAFRRGNPGLGVAALLTSIGFAGVVALEGNRRPIAGLLAFSFLFAVGVAGKKSEALALASFSAFFITLIITAMYT